MSPVRDVPVDLYIVAYDDRDAAKVDWDTINPVVDSGVIKVDELVLVSRRSEGKIPGRRPRANHRRGRRMWRGRGPCFVAGSTADSQRRCGRS